MPPELMELLKPTKATFTEKKPKKAKQVIPSAAKQGSERALEDALDKHITGLAPNQITSRRSSEIKRLEEMFREVDPNYLTSRKKRLGDYFTKEGKLKLLKNAEGIFIPSAAKNESTTEKINPQRRKIENLRQRI